MAGWLDRLRGRRSAASVQAAMAAYARDWLAGADSEGATATGLAVTPESSLAYTAVLACVRVLSEAVASLPCLVYERYDQNGREAKRRSAEHAVYPLVHDAPNTVQTAFEFYEMGMAHILLWGNFYAEIDWSPGGQARGLWPLPAWWVSPKWARDGKWYELQMGSGQREYLPDYRVLHVPGFGYDGVEGKSMIRLAREAIGLGLATEQFGARFFGNGAMPGGVLEHPGKLSDEAYKRLKDSWELRHQGLNNAQRLAILEEGMKLSAIAVPPEDAQFLETRRFQRQDIAAIFRVPPHMIGDLERATFSNIEQQSTDFDTNTLRPWLERWEQRLNRSLLLEEERRTYFMEFLVDAILRADTATRYAAYATGRQWGWLSVNDIRERENMNPVEGGDEYLSPLNMADMAGAGEDEPPTTDDGSGDDAEPEDGGQGARSSEQRLSADVEERSRRAAGGRRRLARTYRQTLQHVAQRIVNREVNDIGQAAKRFLADLNLAGFETWLAAFDEEHNAFVREYLGPALTTYLRLVQAEVERELDEEISDESVEEFGGEYVKGRANAWTAHLMRGARKAARRPEDPDLAWEPLGEVERWLETRKKGRARFVSEEETVRGGNAMALKLYGLAGIVFKVWRSLGSSCPLCSEMDGRKVGIEEWFLPGGNELTGKDGSKFASLSDVGHPPLHDGCDCMIVAGR